MIGSEKASAAFLCTYDENQKILGQMLPSLTKQSRKGSWKPNHDLLGVVGKKPRGGVATFAGGLGGCTWLMKPSRSSTPLLFVVSFRTL